MRHTLKFLNLILIVVFIFGFTACTSSKTVAETTKIENTILETATATTAAVAAGAGQTAIETTKSETTTSETILPDKTTGATQEKTKYKVGDRGPAGGFIIFVNPNFETAEGKYLEATYIKSSSDAAAGEVINWEYIEAAPNDQYDAEGDDWIEWEISPSDDPGKATGATATAIGTGMVNTKKIVNSWGDGIYAAKICYDLTINGYNDWALPSKDELNLMYTVLAKNGAGGFDPLGGPYWSSTECGGEFEGYTAWIQWMDSGDQSDTSVKQYSSRVRAVRVGGISIGSLDDDSLN
jgi:hypothetical protein